ncbi:MAG: glycosyltransferase family 39 protein, partial [Anaerolineaceae bacterium]
LLVYLLRKPAPDPVQPASTWPVIEVNSGLLIASLVFGFLAFLTFSNHQFDLLNTGSWLASIVFGTAAFWQPKPGRPKFTERAAEFFRHPRVRLNITPWTILVLASIVLVVFFRFYRLDEVPGEMFSDHAEKLLDVADVLNGQHWIFFPRNTGREFFQMYLTAFVAQVFGTGLSFMSLKIGTALAGLFALPYIFLLGRELGGCWTGLFAFVFAGVAYWPNVISRIGLRFPLYPLFTAPMLFYLLRGLKRKQWNDLLVAGLFLGLGLHGYSAMRFVPVVVTAAVGLYLLHPQPSGQRKQVIFGFFVLAFLALLVFIPLLRYWVDDPGILFYRSLTRMGTMEQGYSQPMIITFLSNLWKASIMFFWDNGSIWVHSVPGRPALAVVPAALFLLSLLFVFVRYLRRRDWIDMFLLMSIPLLMMPSILSLAFPDENPSLNRTGAAIIPLFIMIGMLLEFVLSRVAAWRRIWGNVLATLMAVFLLLVTINQDYNLVFDQFDNQFMSGAWNTSEIGGVIRGFVDSEIGNPDTAYVVPFPYWVDTRLVGINAGFPEKDYALWPEDFSQTLAQPGAKLFIIKSEDQQSILDLQALYPQSSYWLHTSRLPGKDFWVLLVPPDPTSVDVVQ